MLNSMSTLSASATSSTNHASTSTETETKSINRVLSVIQNSEEKIPILAEGEAEKKLNSMLKQVQRNQISLLNFTGFGRLYEQTERLHTFSKQKSPVTSLAVLENGLLASGSGGPEFSIKLWDLSSYSCIASLTGHTDGVLALAVLPNGRLASGSHDKTIKLWDLSSYSYLATLTGHTDYVYALAVLPNGCLASGSSDKTIKLWDLSSFSCFASLTEHTDGLRALAVLPNGQLASGSWDNTIKLWDLSSYSCFASLTGHTSGVLVLAVLPNEQLASGSYDKTIKLWDLSSFSCFASLTGHTDGLRALAVLPNGHLASGSYDNTIKLWDLSSYSCFASLTGHTYSVSALAVLKNGRLASGSEDKTIKLWDPKFVSLSAKHLLPILKALKSNTSVTELDLSGNPQIADNIIHPLIPIFEKPWFFSLRQQNTTLKTIDLRQTRVTSIGIQKLTQAIQSQSLSVTVLSNWGMVWAMISFLLTFSRANRNSPIVDSGLDICVGSEFGRFLDVPSKWFVRSKSTNDSAQIKNYTHSPS